MVLMNHQTADVMGTTVEDGIGKTDLEILANKVVAERLIANDRRVLAEETNLVFEETVPCADGPHIFLSAKFPVRDGSGAISGIGGVATDITDRKRLEEALLRQIAITTSIFESTTSPIFAVDRQ